MLVYRTSSLLATSPQGEQIMFALEGTDISKSVYMNTYWLRGLYNSVCLVTTYQRNALIRYKATTR